MITGAVSSDDIEHVSLGVGTATFVYYIEVNAANLATLEIPARLRHPTPPVSFFFKRSTTEPLSGSVISTRSRPDRPENSPRRCGTRSSPIRRAKTHQIVGGA
jgi:hypothetical protein